MGKRLCNGRNEGELGPQKEVKHYSWLEGNGLDLLGLGVKCCYENLVQNSWEGRMKRGKRTRGLKRRQDEKANEGSCRSKRKSKGNEENGVKRKKFRLPFSALVALLPFPK